MVNVEGWDGPDTLEVCSFDSKHQPGIPTSWHSLIQQIVIKYLQHAHCRSHGVSMVIMQKYLKGGFYPMLFTI